MMNSELVQAYEFFAVSIAFLGWIIYRQIVTRKVKEKPTLYIILIAIGLNMIIVDILYGKIQLTLSFALIQIGVLAILAVGGGALRAFTCKIWYENDTCMRKGTWLSISLLIVSLAIHVCIDIFFEAGGQYTLILYYGVSLLTQHLIVLQRAKSFLFVQ